MNKAIIVIDFQNDYFLGGKMELIGCEEALANTLELMKYGKKEGYELFLIKHISTREGAGFFLPNTKGVEIHKSLDSFQGEIIEKNYPNSFRETTLLQKLKEKKINNLIVCGAMIHMCIDSTVRAGFDLGFSIEVYENCCATKDLEFNNKTVLAQDIKNSFFAAIDGIFAQVKSFK